MTGGSLFRPWQLIAKPPCGDSYPELYVVIADGVCVGRLIKTKRVWLAVMQSGELLGQYPSWRDAGERVFAQHLHPPVTVESEEEDTSWLES